MFLLRETAIEDDLKALSIELCNGEESELTPTMDRAEARSYRPRDLMEHVNLVLARAEMVTRPPPKPQNFPSEVADELHFLAQELDGTTLGGGDEGLAASSGVVAKGKVEYAIAEDQNCGACAGDIADSGSRSAEVGAVSRVTNEGLLMRRLRRFVLLTPPPLLAAVLPWNRDSDGMREQEQELEANFQGAEVVGATRKKVASGRLESPTETKWCTLPSISGTVINRVTVGDVHHGRAVVGCPFVGELLHFLRSQWRRREEWRWLVAAGMKGRETSHTLT